MVEFEELYKEVRKLANERKMSIPMVFWPYRGFFSAPKIPEKWRASVRDIRGKGWKSECGWGTSPKEALEDLKEKLIENY